MKSVIKKHRQRGNLYTKWHIDWLTDWLTNWLTDQLPSWLTDWPSYGPTDWKSCDFLPITKLSQTDKQATQLTDSVTDWNTDLLDDWPTNQPNRWLASWPANWLPTKDTFCTYLATAFDMMPMLVSCGGMDECPAEVWTLNSAVM